MAWNGLDFAGFARTVDKHAILEFKHREYGIIWEQYRISWVIGFMGSGKPLRHGHDHSLYISSP